MWFSKFNKAGIGSDERSLGLLPWVSNGFGHGRSVMVAVGVTRLVIKCGGEQGDNGTPRYTRAT